MVQPSTGAAGSLGADGVVGPEAFVPGGATLTFIATPIGDALPQSAARLTISATRRAFSATANGIAVVASDTVTTRLVGAPTCNAFPSVTGELVTTAVASTTVLVESTAGATYAQDACLPRCAPIAAAWLAVTTTGLTLSRKASQPISAGVTDATGLARLSTRVTLIDAAADLVRSAPVILRATDLRNAGRRVATTRVALVPGATRLILSAAPGAAATAETEIATKAGGTRSEADATSCVTTSAAAFVARAAGASRSAAGDT